MTERLEEAKLPSGHEKEQRCKERARRRRNKKDENEREGERDKMKEVMTCRVACWGKERRR